MVSGPGDATTLVLSGLKRQEMGERRDSVKQRVWNGVKCR